MWQKMCLCAVAIILIVILLAYFAPEYAPQKVVDMLPKPTDQAAAATVAASFTNKRYGTGTFEERYMPSRGTILRPATM